MPTLRAVTRVIVKMSLYAREVSPAIVPESFKHSTTILLRLLALQTFLLSEPLGSGLLRLDLEGCQGDIGMPDCGC